MRRRHFVIRTIRNGQVKINGQIFRPEEMWMPYDGRLDGMRYVFSLYWRGDEMLPFVSLWGTEAAYHATTDEELNEHWPGPECIDGYFQWEWWHTAEGLEKLQGQREWFEAPAQLRG